MAVAKFFLDILRGHIRNSNRHDLGPLDDVRGGVRQMASGLGNHVRTHRNGKVARLASSLGVISGMWKSTRAVLGSHSRLAIRRYQSRPMMGPRMRPSMRRSPPSSARPRWGNTSRMGSLMAPAAAHAGWTAPLRRGRRPQSAVVA